MLKITVLLILVLFGFFSLKSQIIIPHSLISDVVGTADNEIRTKYGLLGSGTYYQQQERASDKGSAAGGFSFVHPFGSHVKDGKLKALSFIFKYNLSAIRKFVLRDSLYNLSEVGSKISQQFFSYDNNNNINVGLRYNFLNRADNNVRLSIFNIFADVNITNYSCSLDSIYTQKIKEINPDLKISSGFISINPVIGVSFEWSIKLGDDQRLGFGASLSGTANLVYENEEGKNFVPSWSYTMRGMKAITDPNFNKKINNLYAGYGRFYAFFNDIYFFAILRKNFISFSNQELEIQGINNRPVFFSFGVTFSPSLFKF
jgi:hypothetical protein